MDVSRWFAEEWPATAARLDRTLAGRGVARHDREDVLQETALRLYRAWDAIDQDRGVEPYACGVALNVWRDACRRPAARREVVGEVPDVAATDEVERTGLARAELHRVRSALRLLRPQAQQVLRDAAAAELVDATVADPPAVRMARMRARRQLVAVLRAASAVAAFFGAVRARLRPSVTAAGLGTAVVLAALLTPGTGSGAAGVGPQLPGTFRPAGSAQLRTTVDPGRPPGVVTGVPAARRPKPKATLPGDPPPARVEVGPVEATVSVQVDVMDKQVHVRDRDGGVPACTVLGAPARTPLDCY